jgi:hypothetical protein
VQSPEPESAHESVCSSGGSDSVPALPWQHPIDRFHRHLDRTYCTCNTPLLKNEDGKDRG